MQKLGTIYIVATPIGNLKDITIRALETLKKVDYIACEDTRITQKILNHYKINKKSFIIYNDQATINTRKKIINFIKKNKNIALVSNAGSPLISDPGFKLIKLLKLSKINNIKVIPGPCAIIAALSISGLNTDKFIFYGFIDKKTKIKKN